MCLNSMIRRKTCPPYGIKLIITGILISASLSGGHCQDIFPVKNDSILYVRKFRCDSLNTAVLLKNTQVLYDQIREDQDPGQTAGYYNSLNGTFTKTFSINITEQGLITQHPAGSAMATFRLLRSGSFCIFQINGI